MSRHCLGTIERSGGRKARRRNDKQLITVAEKEKFRSLG